MRKEMDLEGGRDRAHRCRNCMFTEDEDARPGAAPVPGSYCRNPLGVFSMDDCPVILGRECRQFVEREGPPAAASEDDLAEARQELLRDYLRWPYWERVRNLRRTPEEIAKKTVLPVEEEPEKPEEEFVYRAPVAPAAAEGAPPGKEKPPEEKYPGQRRSEDRYRKQKVAAAEARRRAAEAAEATAAGMAGESIAAAPAEALPAAPPETPLVRTLDDILAETPAAKSVPPPRPAGRPEREGERHGGRRRRRRGRGGPLAGAPSPPPGAAAPAPPPPVPSTGGGVPPAPGAPGGDPRHRRRRRRHRHGRGQRPGGPGGAPGGGGSAPPPPPAG